MAHPPDLNLATRHPEDPERLIIVCLGPIAMEHAAPVAYDFLLTAQILPIYLDIPPSGKLFPISYRALSTELFASIVASSLKEASDWLDLLGSNCVMFNP